MQVPAQALEFSVEFISNDPPASVDFRPVPLADSLCDSGRAHKRTARSPEVFL